MDTDGRNLKLVKCEQDKKSQKWSWRERFY